MNISLDFDKTYTQDPELWDNFIDNATKRGHNVYCVTMRYESEGDEVKEMLGGKVKEIFFTGRMAKRSYLVTQFAPQIDVWIDDWPESASQNCW